MHNACKLKIFSLLKRVLCYIILWNKKLIGYQLWIPLSWVPFLLRAIVACPWSSQGTLSYFLVTREQCHLDSLTPCDLINLYLSSIFAETRASLKDKQKLPISCLAERIFCLVHLWDSKGALSAFPPELPSSDTLTFSQELIHLLLNLFSSRNESGRVPRACRNIQIFFPAKSHSQCSISKHIFQYEQ